MKLTPDRAMYLIGIGSILVIAFSMWRLHRDPANDFNILDLLMENGRVSRLATAFMATLVVTSWIVVKLAIDGRLTEGYFAAYCTAWVAPIIAKLFTPGGSNAQPTYRPDPRTGNDLPAASSRGD